MAKCTHLGLWEDRGHGRPLEEQEVMAGPILHLLSVSMSLSCPWLWDRGTSMYRQTGVRKDPTEPAQLATEWVWGRWGDGCRRQRILFV